MAILELLELEKFDFCACHDIRNVQEGVLVAEAGVTLHNADRCAEEHGHVVPLDLAPKKDCQLGGNLATNAGGLRFLRYGSLRGSVVGVEVSSSEAHDV